LSWTAHDFEPYAIQKHLGSRVTLLPLYIGSLGPDLMTKWYVYGVELFGFELKADAPALFHRGWPGAGFTHSPFFGIALALLVFLVSRKGVWAFSLGLGLVAHAVTDILDTNGTMLLFPFSTERISLGAWAYAAEGGRHNDGIAYYSSLGLAADLITLVLVLISWRVLKRSYFESTVYGNDPVMRFAGRWLPMDALMAIYRFGFIFGVTRLTAWILFVHILNTNPFDFGWGGPHWVTPIR
jgi:membrane-bound metal-dependent hydrolase YbcI (DUF457 family)